MVSRAIARKNARFFVGPLVVDLDSRELFARVDTFALYGASRFCIPGSSDAFMSYCAITHDAWLLMFSIMVTR